MAMSLRIYGGQGRRCPASRVARPSARSSCREHIRTPSKMIPVGCAEKNITNSWRLALSKWAGTRSTPKWLLKIGHTQMGSLGVFASFPKDKMLCTSWSCAVPNKLLASLTHHCGTGTAAVGKPSLLQELVAWSPWGVQNGKAELSSHELEISVLGTAFETCRLLWKGCGVFLYMSILTIFQKIKTHWVLWVDPDFIAQCLKVLDTWPQWVNNLGVP